MGDSVSGYFADARHCWVVASTTDTFIEEVPTSIPSKSIQSFFSALHILHLPNLVFAVAQRVFYANVGIKIGGFGLRRKDWRKKYIFGLMKWSAYCVFLVFAFVRCDTRSARLRHNLAIPDTVSVSRDSGQVQFYGTHLFMRMPAGFRFDSLTAGWSKNPWTYIDAEDAPMSFSGRTYEINENPENQKSGGFTTYYRKDFNYQGDTATILYGLDKSQKGQPNEKIIFAFGNGAGSGLITAHFRAVYDDDRAQIIKSLFSCYRIDTATVDLSAIQRFDVDMQQSGYRFYKHAHSGFYYAIDGKGDPIDGRFRKGIIISEEVPLSGDEALRQRVGDIVTSYDNKLFHRETREDNQLVIGGLNAYENILEGSFNGKATAYYTLMLQNKNIALCFQALADTKVEESVQAFHKIALTLRIR